MSRTCSCRGVVEGNEGVGFRLRPKTKFVKSISVKNRLQISRQRRENLSILSRWFWGERYVRTSLQDVLTCKGLISLSKRDQGEIRSDDNTSWFSGTTLSM